MNFLTNSQPLVMGILNVTPDSFSDGGHYFDVAQAVAHGLDMVANGASIIDIGGESTRPGAPVVTLKEELSRVIPIIEALRQTTDVCLSIDTQKPEVMRAAVQAGAGFINDVNALRTSHAVEVAVECDVPVCLMHMQGNPQNMQRDPAYADPMQAVKVFLAERIEVCLAAGIPSSHLIIDPGIGFGKTVAHNFALLRELNQLLEFELPILVGVSRKSLIGELLKRKLDDRLAGSLALAMLAVQKGAQIIRAHDVKETVDVLKIQQHLS